MRRRQIANLAGHSNALLWQVRMGYQWSYLRNAFGSWNTIWRTFCRWRDRIMVRRDLLPALTAGAYDLAPCCLCREAGGLTGAP